MPSVRRLFAAMQALRRQHPATAMGLTLAVLGLFAAACGQLPGQQGLKVNRNGPMADLDWEVRTLNGSTVSLSDLKGKVLFINIWASWCGPCVAEMPSIEALHEMYGEEGLEVLAISVDDSPADARRFMDNKGFNIPVYTPASRLPEQFRGQYIPRTFLVSPEGRLVLEYVGGYEWDGLDSVNIIEDLLAEVES